MNGAIPRSAFLEMQRVHDEARTRWPKSWARGATDLISHVRAEAAAERLTVYAWYRKHASEADTPDLVVQLTALCFAAIQADLAKGA